MNLGALTGARARTRVAAIHPPTRQAVAIPGALFEGFVAAEILKSQADRGMRKELYYFRDQQGLEVDFLVPRPNAKLWLVEAKAAKTVRPTMASPLISLQRALQKRAGRLIVVNRKSRLQTPTAAIASGVEALDVEQFVGELLRT